MPPKANKVEVELKKLTKLDGNKICANCPEKMPGYAEMTHCIFICTKCAGVHRDFQYKVKGISMSTFSDEDVLQLSRVGNEAHNSIYMARHVPRDYPIPNGTDVTKLKEFIRMKYVDRRWYDGSGSNAFQQTGNNSHIPAPQNSSIHRGGAPPAPLNRKTSMVTNTVLDLDLLSLSDSVPPKPTSDPFSTSTAPNNNNNNNNNNNSSSFDPFGSNSPSNQSFDAFSSHPQQQQQHQQPQQQNHFDAFGSSNTFPQQYPQQSGFNAFNSPPPQHGFHPNPYQQHQPVPMMPMPYIKIAPPSQPAPPVSTENDSKAIAKAAATGVSEEVAKGPKNFSVFDNLLDDDPTVAAANPFANPNNFNAQQPQQPPNSSIHPPHPQPGFPHPPPPYGYPPPGPQGFGYPPHPHHPYGPGLGQGPFPPVYGQQFPPQPPYGYPPQPHPGYGYPPHAYPPNPNQPGPVPGQAPGQVPVPVPVPAAVPTAPVAPDPFEKFSNLAWNALGSAPPPSSSNPNPSSSVPAPVSDIFSDPSLGFSPQPPVPNPVPVSNPNPPSASVNPFDLF